MRKAQELVEGCMSRAGEREMTFVLLSRDVAAPETIRFWVRERIRLGRNKPADPQIVEALECAQTMQEERATVPPSPPAPGK